MPHETRDVVKLQVLYMHMNRILLAVGELVHGIDPIDFAVPSFRDKEAGLLCVTTCNCFGPQGVLMRYAFGYNY